MKTQTIEIIQTASGFGQIKSWENSILEILVGGMIIAGIYYGIGELKAGHLGRAISFGGTAILAGALAVTSPFWIKYVGNTAKDTAQDSSTAQTSTGYVSREGQE